MMMMQSRVTLCIILSVLLCIETAIAVPAIVWNKSQQSVRGLQDNDEASYYISNEISVEQMLMSESSTLNTNTNNDLTVIFLLERDSKTGQEVLTSMTPKLHQTLQQPHTTPKQYSHVSGVESGANVLKKFQTSSTAIRPVLVNFQEWGYKFNHTLASSSSDTEVVMDEVGDATVVSVSLPPRSMPNQATIKATKRQRLMEASNFVIVTVPHSIPVEVLDETLYQTIQSLPEQTIVLTSVRSVEEVKYERHLAMKRQLLDKAIIVDGTKAQTSTDPYHRRLDQQDGNNNNNNDDMSGVYYVQMTPNILAGLLFFGLFIVITMIGISCMNMITGQDVYVSTMPSIGREA